MIRSFADREMQRLFATGTSRTIPSTIQRRALARLVYLDRAKSPGDLRVPMSNRLEQLSGSRSEQWSVRINEQ